MKREQFERMQAAAQLLIDVATSGAHPVDPFSLEWAHSVVAMKNPMPPPRSAYAMNLVMEAMQGHPAEGYLSSDIRRRSGLKSRQVAATLYYLVRSGNLAMLKIPTRSRFFLTIDAMELGRKLVEEMERHRIERRSPTTPPSKGALKQRRFSDVHKPVVTCNEPAIPKIEAGSKLTKESESVFIPPLRWPPAEVTITELPSGRDTRYTVDPKDLPAGGFLDDWMQKRRKGDR